MSLKMEPQISGLKMMIYMVVIFQITQSQDTERNKNCTEEFICTLGIYQVNMERCAENYLTFKVHNLLFEVFSNYTGVEYKRNDLEHFSTNVMPEICKDEFGGSKALDRFYEHVDSNVDGLSDKDTESHEDFKACIEDKVKECVAEIANKCMKEERKKYWKEAVRKCYGSNPEK